MDKTTEQHIIDLIRDNITGAPDTITAQTEIADLNMDSLDGVEMIMHVEDLFSIEIDDPTADGFKTIGDVVAYVDKTVEQNKARNRAEGRI